MRLALVTEYCGASLKGFDSPFALVATYLAENQSPAVEESRTAPSGANFATACKVRDTVLSYGLRLNGLSPSQSVLLSSTARKVLEMK
jgi:hypothetical protein